MRRRLRGGPVLLVATLLAAACSVSESPYPVTGSLFVTLRATGLGTQATSDARLQYVRWEIARLDGLLSEPPIVHPFVSTPPCIVAATPVSDGDVRRCGGSGLTLEAGPARTVDFQLHFARVDGIAANRPDLPDAGDYDGDGVPNASDNCKLVPNPLEPDGEGGFAQPKTCYLEDANDEPTIPDQDGDLVADALDNCLWFPNPIRPGATTQPDANVNGIGDECERTLPVALPAGGLYLDCPGEFTVSGSTVSLFTVDFTDALNCDLQGGTCDLALPGVDQPTEITLRRSDQLSSQAVACTRTDAPAR